MNAKEKDARIKALEQALFKSLQFFNMAAEPLNGDEDLFASEVLNECEILLERKP